MPNDATKETDEELEQEIQKRTRIRSAAEKKDPPGEDLDQRIRRWLDGDRDPGNESEIACAITGLVKAIVGHQLEEDGRRDVVSMVNLNVWRLAEEGKFPPENCKASTAISRMAICRIRDLLRRRYAKKRAPIVYVGGGRELEIAAGERRGRIEIESEEAYE